MKVRYSKHEFNEWITPVKNGYRLRCCDCGLVHDIDFSIERKSVKFRARRNNIATSASRRSKKYELLVNAKKSGERVNFEKWATGQGFRMNTKNDGVYVSDETAVAWDSWRAALE